MFSVRPLAMPVNRRSGGRWDGIGGAFLGVHFVQVTVERRRDFNSTSLMLERLKRRGWVLGRFPQLADPCDLMQPMLLCGLAQWSDFRPVTAGLHRVPQIPLRLQR